MQQADLFFANTDTPELAIPGLSLIPDYISIGQEQSLLSDIDRQPWLSDLKRRVQHYGYRYDYKSRAISRDAFLGPLPEWISPLCSRLEAQKIFPGKPDQVIVNEYLPGQGISAHIDCVPCFGNPVASLSLGASCIMEFSNPRTGENAETVLGPRSLVILSGPARYEWQHAIPARKSDVIHGAKVPRDRRVSLTFRTVIL